MLPNFLVVGAQKAGTTSLHHYMKGHPDICLPDQKETKFFGLEEKYRKGIEFYQHKYFSECDGRPAVGEIDPEYMYFVEAYERIKSHLDMKRLKLLFVLRNPIERAFSHYLMTYRRGLEPLPFDEAIDAEAERVVKSEDDNLHYSYVARGFYLEQILRFHESVCKERMHFILSEDLKQNPEGVLENLFRFLEVDTGYVPENICRQFHGATVPRSMSLLKRVEA